jgi:RNA polymerase sigma-70 factor (ECF subfamily)
LTEPGGESEFERARRAADERVLVAAAVGGSASAFETLYRTHVGKVYGLCLRMTANPTIAEDCAQDAFVQAWRSLPAFEARSSFGTWLHRIAVNSVLARGRRREEVLGSDASAEESVAETLPDLTSPDAGTAIDLEQAIAQLPPGARQALVLVGIYGYSHAEAAALLGIAIGTCKSQLHRARQLLGQHLDAPEVV